MGVLIVQACKLTTLNIITQSSSIGLYTSNHDAPSALDVSPQTPLTALPLYPGIVILRTPMEPLRLRLLQPLKTHRAASLEFDERSTETCPPAPNLPGVPVPARRQARHCVLALLTSPQPLLSGSGKRRDMPTIHGRAMSNAGYLLIQSLDT